ncbi:MAG: glycogen synthase GlgA [Clostridiales bacterium]|nr:glycogen synthase GlgA [Clostridiales bacterium]
MNVLFAVSEAAPFVKTGGLADVAGSLPAALKLAGTDTRVILPLYSAIKDEYRSKMEFLFYTYVDLGWRHQYCGLFSLEHEGVTFYFIDSEYYFKRDKIYGCMDDGERFAFFSKAIVTVLPLLNFRPDLINCNDWQTALVPIYLNLEPAGFYRGIKTVYTIHNIEYQGSFSFHTADDVFGLPKNLYEEGLLRYDDGVNLMKGAIYFADYVTTVSPNYAEELRYPFYAHGLHEVISQNSHKLTGIINGLDTCRYNPETDKALPCNFSAGDTSGKAECKRQLCAMLSFDEDDGSPIIACVSRLVEHKGFDLVAHVLDDIIAKGARLAILGTGDQSFEDFFRSAGDRYPRRVSANIMYSEKMASLMYAGADMLLMPSKSEPCGLSQLIAMRYGTVPIVRSAGGLRDTVIPYPAEGSNGFRFDNYDAYDMLGTIGYALEIYEDKPQWQLLMKGCMTQELGWERSAKRYVEVYSSLFD